MLYGISDYNIYRLQRIQNTAARTVINIRKYDHITPILQKLHWLPVRLQDFTNNYLSMTWHLNIITNWPPFESLPENSGYLSSLEKF